MRLPSAVPCCASTPSQTTGRRQRYARWQPVFWRPAADAQDKHRAYFSDLVARGEVIALVSEHVSQLDGFLIATLVPIPLSARSRPIPSLADAPAAFRYGRGVSDARRAVGHADG